MKSFPRLLVPFAAVLVTLLLLEGGLRVYDAARAYTTRQTPPVPPVHVLTDEPYLYGLNPAHPGISAQGTRDDAAVIPKPEGAFRVLVLGDSLAFAATVPVGKTFPNRLESLLRAEFPHADVINAGVSGYTPYNELQYYLSRGRAFGADVVVVAFCMNDVVNPRLHWGDAPGVRVPDEAIPNHTYDREHVVPRLQRLKEQQARGGAQDAGGPPLLKHSRLYKSLEPGLRRLFGKDGQAKAGPGGVPTYVTGEDDLSIEVLLDPDSPESRWLARIYDRLHAAVRADGARLVVALFPLAYQSDEGYPHFPQARLADYCASRSIPCLDLLAPFKRRPKEEVFLLNNSGYYDVWHLTEQGHQLAAEELLRFMREQNLLPPS